ncbi:MAG: hypothetical protein AAGU75_19885, partial [Bacillota bacterium]
LSNRTQPALRQRRLLSLRNFHNQLFTVVGRDFQFSSISSWTFSVIITLAADFVLHYNQRKGKCQGKKVHVIMNEK